MGADLKQQQTLLPIPPTFVDLTYSGDLDTSRQQNPTTSVCFGCFEKMHIGVISSSEAFSHVSGVEKAWDKVLANLVSGEGSFLGSSVAVLCPQCWRQTGLLQFLSS